MLFFSIFLLLIFIFGIASYILSSYALMMMAKGAGLQNAHLSWVPIANFWVWGELLKEKLGNHAGLKVLIPSVIYLLFSMDIWGLPELVIGIITILYLIFAVIITFWLFKKFSEKPILHTVLSIIVPLYYPIVFFVICKNEPKQI